MSKILKVGIVQQSNTANIEQNKAALKAGIESCAKQGAQLVVLQELHNSLYFCQTEDTNLFDLAEPIPGPSTDFYSQVARACGVVLVTSLFERRAPGLYHNTAVVFDSDGSMAESIARCTSPTTLLITKSSTLHPAIWVLSLYRHQLVNWVYWYAGINGTPRQPV